MQLRHLRAHRAFQGQDRYKTARLDWVTTISQEESHQHITRHLQAKVNLKDPRQGSRGRMDTPEGQDSMKRLAQMIQRRHRLSPGDGHMLSWNLRHRMVQSNRSHLSDESAPPGSNAFPQRSGPCWMNSKKSGNSCPSRAPAPSVTGRLPSSRSTPAASAITSSTRTSLKKGNPTTQPVRYAGSRSTKPTW